MPKSAIKKQRGTTEKGTPSRRTHPIHKIYNRRDKSYKQFGPHPKITKKIMFNPLHRILFVIGCPIDPFLPNCLEKA